MPTNATGAFLGLACGDALGRPVEFKSPGQIQSMHGTVTEMLADGTHGQPAGTVSDDTDQALCIARSLAEDPSFDADDVAARFVDWYNSRPFDIGITTRKALRRLDAGVDWERAGEQTYAESGPNSGAGNGSVMRCPPVAIAFRDNRDRLVSVSRDTSRITHADPRCVEGAAALNIVIAGYLRGDEDPLGEAVSWLEDVHDHDSREVYVRLRRVHNDPRDDDRLPNGGYVVDTLETALTVAERASSFEEAVVTAVNLGGDTDTVGAVTGAVAGARFGEEAVPERWTAEIEEEDEIRRLSAELADS